MVEDGFPQGSWARLLGRELFNIGWSDKSEERTEVKRQSLERAWGVSIWEQPGYR